MSRDCTYLFVWESQPYSADPPYLALQTLCANRTIPAGKVLLMNHKWLIWECDKHGLNPEHWQFPILPDQVFESADGGLFYLQETSK